MKHLRPQLARAYDMKRSNPVEALNLIRRIIAQKPNYREALDFRNALTRELVSADYLSADLSEAMRKPLSLEFSAQSLSTIFETIARLSGVNFVIDKDVNPSASASMTASRTTAEDALNLLLTTQDPHPGVGQGHGVTAALQHIDACRGAARVEQDVVAIDPPQRADRNARQPGRYVGEVAHG